MADLERRLVEVTEETGVRDGRNFHEKGARFWTSRHNYFCNKTGWCKDVETQEQGERNPGHFVVEPDDVHVDPAS